MTPRNCRHLINVCHQTLEPSQPCIICLRSCPTVTHVTPFCTLLGKISSLTWSFRSQQPFIFCNIGNMIEKPSEKEVVYPTLRSSSSSSYDEHHQQEELPTVRLALLGLGLDMPLDLYEQVLMCVQSVHRAIPQLSRQLYRGDQSSGYWQGVQRHRKGELGRIGIHTVLSRMCGFPGSNIRRCRATWRFLDILPHLYCLLDRLWLRPKPRTTHRISNYSRGGRFRCVPHSITTASYCGG